MSICTSLDLYLEMGAPMSENQVKESQSRLASHHPHRWGMGCYSMGVVYSNTTYVETIRMSQMVCSTSPTHCLLSSL